MANSGVLVRCVCEFPRYYSNWIMKLGVTVVSSSLFVCLFVCLCFPFFSALSILWCSWACPPPFFSNTAFILGNWCSQTRLPNTGSSAYSTCSIEFSNRGGRARHWNATKSPPHEEIRVLWHILFDFSTFFGQFQNFHRFYYYMMASCYLALVRCGGSLKVRAGT